MSRRPGPAAAGLSGTRGQRALGAMFLAQFALTCAVKAAGHHLGEVLWVSHVSLLTAGVGLLIGSELLVGATLVLVLLPHAVWLADAAWFLVSGNSPLGITGYLAAAGPWDWAATAHHFYLVPALLTVAVRGRVWRGGAPLLAATLVVYLLVAGYALDAQHGNVNYAHGLLGRVDHPWLDALNGLPSGAYLPAMIGLTWLVVVAPGSVLVRWWCGLRAAGQAGAKRRRSTAVSASNTASASPRASTTS